MTNEKEVIACVTVMAATLRQEVTAPMLQGFCLALADLTTDELRKAVGRALAESKFFPSPAELREYAGRKVKRLEAPYHAPIKEPEWARLPPVPLTAEQQEEVRTMVRELANQKACV